MTIHIVTQECQLTLLIYRRFAWVMSLMKVWWFFVIISILLIISLILQSWGLIMYCLGVVCLILGLIYFQIRRYTQNPQNTALFQKRTYEFTDEFTMMHGERGHEIKMPNTEVVKVVKGKRAYLVYIAQQQFYYVPFTAFAQVTDQADFEGLFHDKLIPKKTTA